MPGHCLVTYACTPWGNGKCAWEPGRSHLLRCDLALQRGNALVHALHLPLRTPLRLLHSATMQGYQGNRVLQACTWSLCTMQHGHSGSMAADNVVLQAMHRIMHACYAAMGCSACQSVLC